jgi:hypothetical protein
LTTGLEIDKHGRVCLSVAGVTYMSTRTKIIVERFMDKNEFEVAQANGRDYVGSYAVVGERVYEFESTNGAGVLAAMKQMMQNSKREWTAVEEIVYDKSNRQRWRKNLPEAILLAQLQNVDLKAGGVFRLRVLDSE